MQNDWNGLIILYAALAVPYLAAALAVVLLVRDGVTRRWRRSTVIVCGIAAALLIVRWLLSGAI